MKKILFNSVCKSANYLTYTEELYQNYDLFREKHFSKRCLEQLETRFPASKLFLTHSATGGLEMIAHLMNIEKGDEIIMPSFTFIATANSFVGRGATPVFVDIDSTTLNLDLDLVEAAINPKTKAIVMVHYGGHASDMNRLKSICKKHKIYLVEDAAMSFGNHFNGQPLGSIGDFGVISFDITKQISAVQGGLLLVNNPDFQKRADSIYHLGTNRSEFMAGNVPYYEWVDFGSKYQMNELNALALFDQLNTQEAILKHRNQLSKWYYELLSPLAEKGFFRLMPKTHLEDNIHEFYLILDEESTRVKLVEHLNENGIEAMFHYIPLHNSSFGKERSRFKELSVTESISAALLRLPMHGDISLTEITFITRKIKNFYHE